MAYGVALEAAQLRLSAAERWAEASAEHLERAKNQVATSQRELDDAREYLDKLKRERKRWLDADIDCVFSGETENETLFSGGSHDDHCSTGTERRLFASTPSPRDDKSPGVNDNGHEAEEERLAFTHNDYTVEREQAVRANTIPSAEEVKMEKTGEASSVATPQSYIGEVTAPFSVGNIVAVEVEHCGISEVNGKYTKFESSDGVPSYSKIDTYEGKEAIFTIGRWQSETGTKRWCITATVPRVGEFAFYVAYAPSFVVHPPTKNWMAVGRTETFLPPEHEARGIEPAPTITHEYDKKKTANHPNAGYGGGTITENRDSGSSRKGRQSGRSSSTPRPCSTKRGYDRSVSTGRFRRREGVRLSGGSGGTRNV